MTYLTVCPVCVCVTFVVLTDCELYEADSTNTGSMEAGEYGLTRGACFVAICVEVVAVAGLMWVSWYVFGGAGFFRFCFSIFVFLFERTRSAASMRPPCLIYLSTSNEENRGRFLPMGKKPLHTGVRTGCHYVISLRVCQCVCV